MKTSIVRFIAFALVLTAQVASAAPSVAAAERAPFDVTMRVPHEAQILNQGIVALEKRLQMIEQARENIDLEYFIFGTDKSSRLIAQALVQAKRANPRLRIRILVDGSGTVLQLDDFFAAEFAKHGIELRTYNPSPFILIVSTQYRNHRKTMIVDGEEALTGGRNIADEYFDLSAEYNFIDRDIWFRGPIVAKMAESFEAYWNDDHVSRARKVAPPVAPQPDPDRMSDEIAYQAALKKYKTSTAAAKSFLTSNASDLALRAEVARVAGPHMAEGSGVCNEIRVVTDEPGYLWGTNWANDGRYVREALMEKVGDVRSGDEVLAESPYVILHERGREALHALRAKGVKTKILTNSLNSTDAFYVAAIFNSHAWTYSSDEALDFFTFAGAPLKDTLYAKDSSGREIAKGARWGSHAKTVVFGQDSFSVGTFNIDPRSANLNNEEIVICNSSPELTQVIRADIEKRLALSYELDRLGKPKAESVTQLSGAGIPKSLMYLASMIPVSLLSFLF